MPPKGKNNKHVDVPSAVEIEAPATATVASASATASAKKTTTDVHVLVHGRLTVPLQLSVTEALRSELGGEGLYRETVNEAIKLAVASQFCGFRGIEVNRVRPVAVAAARKAGASGNTQRSGGIAAGDSGGLVEAAQSLRNRYIRPPVPSGESSTAALAQHDLVAHPAAPAGAATHAVPFAVPRAHLTDGDAIVAAVDLGAFRGNLDQLISSYDAMAARLEGLQQGPLAAMDATLKLLEAHAPATAGTSDEGAANSLAALVAQLREQQRVCALLVQEALAPPADDSMKTEQRQETAAHDEAEDEDAEAAVASRLTPEELAALQQQQKRMERRSLLDASDDDADVPDADADPRAVTASAADGEAAQSDDDAYGDAAYLRRRGFTEAAEEGGDSEFDDDEGDMDPRQMGYVALEESE